MRTQKTHIKELKSSMIEMLAELDKLPEDMEVIYFDHNLRDCELNVKPAYKIITDAATKIKWLKFYVEGREAL